MKKTVFTIGAVLLITSGFVSESFGTASSGSGYTPPPTTGSTTGTGTAPAKVAGNAQTFEEKQVALKTVPVLVEAWKAIQSSPTGICTGDISSKKSSDLYRAGKCATKNDEPSMLLKLVNASKKTPEARKVLCALVANISQGFYSSLTSKFTFSGAKDKQANVQIPIQVSSCYTHFR